MMTVQYRKNKANSIIVVVSMLVLTSIEIFSDHNEIKINLLSMVGLSCEGFVPKVVINSHHKFHTISQKMNTCNNKNPNLSIRVLCQSPSSSDLGQGYYENNLEETNYSSSKKRIEIPDFFLHLKERYDPKKPLSTSRIIITEFEQIQDKNVVEAATRFMLTETLFCDTNNGNDEFQKTLVSLLTPRDQTNLIRYLGSRGLYYTMSCLLRHLATNLNFYTPSNESDGKNMYNNIQYAYSAAITALAQSTNPKYRTRTLLLLDEMDDFGIPPNSYIITAIFLSIDGGKGAREMLKRARIYKGIDIDVRLYNAAIYACSRTYNDAKNGWESALSLFREMRREGIQPNQQTYGSLLQACAKSGQVKVAFSLFDEMKNTPNMDVSNVKVWGAILRACSATGEWEKAIELVLEMREKRVPINVIHMNAVLASFAKEGFDTEALIVLNAMQNGYSVIALEELLPSHSTMNDDKTNGSLPSPDLVSVNTVLAAFADRNKKDEAMELLERVKSGDFSYRRGSKWCHVKPDIVSYNSVLATFQEPRDALSFIHQIRMTRKNRYNPIKPSCQTYTIAISICSRSDPPDLTTALSLLKDAQIKDGLKANHFMYSATIWTAERCGDAECALSLLKQMKQERCRPNTACYNGVLAALAQNGMFTESVSVIRDMKRNRVPLGPSTFQHLVAAASKSDVDIESVLYNYEQIISILNREEHHVSQSGQIFSALIRGYGSTARTDDALRVFNSLEQTNAQCLSSMLFVCSTSSPARWKEAIMILHMSDIVVGAQGPGKVEAMALSYAIIACSKENEWEEAINLLELYGTTDGSQLSTVTIDAINSIIAAAGRCGRPDVSVKILNEISPKYFLKPNERSYRSAIIACNQAEHEKRRHKQKPDLVPDFEASHQSDEIESNDFTFSWWEVAISLFRRMKEDRLEPSIQTYSSVISACEAAGQWQRAIGILGSMNRETTATANLFCFNAALAACEKGNAWLEAVELYERMSAVGLKPNFVTLNSVLIALEKGDQRELAESIYKQALKDKVLSPWKYTLDSNQKDRIRAMDLHQFSVPMAKIAVRTVMDSLLLKTAHDVDKDLVIVLGKGKGSVDGKTKLMPSIRKLLKEEYGLDPLVEKNNSGRIRLRMDKLKDFIETRRWN